MKDNMTHIEREAFKIVREELMNPDFMTTCRNDGECPCVQHRFALIEELYTSHLTQVRQLVDERHNLEKDIDELIEMNKALDMDVEQLGQEKHDLEREVEDLTETITEQNGMINGLKDDIAYGSYDLPDAHDNTFGHSREDYIQKSETQEIANLKDELKDANEIIDDLSRDIGKLEEELDDTNDQLSRRSRPHEYEDDRGYYPDGSDAPIRDIKLPWSQPSSEDRSRERERADKWYRKVSNMCLDQWRCADDHECTCDDCEAEAQKIEREWDADICRPTSCQLKDGVVKSITWQRVTIGGVYNADEDEDMWLRTITYYDDRTQRDIFEHGPDTDNDSAVR